MKSDLSPSATSPSMTVLDALRDYRAMLAAAHNTGPIVAECAKCQKIEAVDALIAGTRVSETVAPESVCVDGRKWHVVKESTGQCDYCSFNLNAPVSATRRVEDPHAKFAYGTREEPHDKNDEPGRLVDRLLMHAQDKAVRMDSTMYHDILHAVDRIEYLARERDEALAKATPSAIGTPEAKTHQQFADCVRNLVNGSAFDLTDSPKSFISTVQRLVSEMDAPQYVRGKS